MDTFPFLPGKDLDANIQIDTKGKVKIYVDDGITVVPDLDENRLRGTNAMALAICNLPTHLKT
jgi:hypothetical protein